MQMDQHEGRGEEAHVAGVHARVQVSDSRVGKCPGSAAHRPGRQVPRRCPGEVRRGRPSCWRTAGAARRAEPGGGGHPRSAASRLLRAHVPPARALCGLRRPEAPRPSGPKVGFDQRVARAGCCTGAAGFKPAFAGHLTWVTCSQNQEAMLHCRDPTRIAKPTGLYTSVRRGPEGRQDTRGC